MLAKPFLIIENYIVAHRKLILYEHDLLNVTVIEPKIQINVRQASLDDMEKLVEKSANERRVKKRKYMKRVLERLKAGHCCFIAERSDEIVGYAWIALQELYVMEIERKMSLKEDEAMFYDVYTFSIHRGKGIAPKIYEEAINHLRKNNYKKIYIAMLQHNKPSQRAAEKLNFKAVETITFLKIFGVKKLARATTEVRVSILKRGVM